MKPQPVANNTEKAASATMLQDFGEFLARPDLIQAVIPGGNIISNKLIQGDDVALIVAGQVVVITGGNESRALVDSIRSGIRQRVSADEVLVAATRRAS